jgi:hypothetical protein
MRFIKKLERRLGRYAIPNLTMFLILGQVALYLMVIFGQGAVKPDVALIPGNVLQGEVWRLITFLFVPPPVRPIFVLFYWYLFFLMGTALESHWGTFRYNLFLLAGTLATIGAAFAVAIGTGNANTETTGLFLQGSVFLAFAFLYPNFVLHIMFILPVKIKWLALLTWFFYARSIVMGDWTMRFMAAAAVANFFLFFGRDIYQRIKHGRRRMVMQTKLNSQKGKPRHVCTTCGVTNLSDPKMRFRYCSTCEGQCGYCMDHINDHEHVSKEPVA